MDEKRMPVLVKVTSAERDERGRMADGMQLLLPGELYRRDGAWVLHYNETVEDEADHSTVTHDVHLRVRDGQVTLLRKGPYSMMMMLKQRESYKGLYRTPYGDMDLSVFPTVVKTDLEETRGRILLEYQLEVAASPMTLRRMVIEYSAQRRSKPC